MLVLTVPLKSSVDQALRWAAEQSDFIRRTARNLPKPSPFIDGAIIPYEGENIQIAWKAKALRSPMIESGQVIVGGPQQRISNRIERWLKAQALEKLTLETYQIAASHDLSVGKISIGDPKGRWGSCSSDGTIRYSWRLILAPPFVRIAVVAHEVAHLLHHNHSAEFHALVDQLLGQSARPAYRWLQHHGAALHWVGRAD